MLRLRSTVPLLVMSLALPPACRPAQNDKPRVAEQAVVEAREAIREQAWKDLQSDVLTLKTQLTIFTSLLQSKTATTQQRSAQASAALYTCDRLALAGKQLGDDARAQATLGEADAMCAYQAPLAAGEQRLVALETSGDSGPAKMNPADCGATRDVITRVGAKYRTDPKLLELASRFKAACPRVRLFSNHAERSASSSLSTSSRPDPSGQRQECRDRCERAAFSCRASCQYCGVCTSDKTWDWCNATCNSCKQGCEQNEKFCKASCGG